MRLRDRTAIITGASRGLGRALACAFAAAGANLLLMARDGEILAAAQQELAAAAGKVEVHVGDVRSPDDCAAAVRRACGLGTPLTILVNNAAVQGPIGPLDQVPWDEWLTTIQVNLFGTVLMCRAVLPEMRRHGYGKIINLSGGGATAPRPNFSAYAAAKTAVVRLTETLAEEVREAHIDVNAIAPGSLNTRMLEEILAAGPERVGAAPYAQALKQRDSGGTALERATALVEFLASTESDGITGRLFSAVWDDWASLADRKAQLARSDVFTLRRIVPDDRKGAWQCA